MLFSSLWCFSPLTAPIYRLLLFYIVLCFLSVFSFFSFFLFFSVLFLLLFLFKNVCMFHACFVPPWRECDSRPDSGDEWRVRCTKYSAHEWAQQKRGSMRLLKLRNYRYEEAWMCVEQNENPTSPLRDLQGSLWKVWWGWGVRSHLSTAMVWYIYHVVCGMEPTD